MRIVVWRTGKVYFTNLSDQNDKFRLTSVLIKDGNDNDVFVNSDNNTDTNSELSYTT